MKLFQRVTAMALVIVMCMCVLTGCGKQGAASSSAQSGAVSGSVSVEREPLGTVELSTVTDICTYLCGLAPDTVVATADGMDITAGELMYWLVTNCDNMVEYYSYYQGTDQLPWTAVIGEEEEPGKTFAEYMVEDSVKYAAIQRIVERKAKEAGIAVKQEDKQAVQTSLDTLADQLAADTDKVSVEQYLWQQALTNELFAWNYQMDYLYQGLSDHYFGEGGEREPTEEILLSYLDTAGYYSVKHILLETKEATDEVKAQKKAKAEELLAQIKASGNDQALFDKLMKENSEDPGLATSPEGYTFQANTNIDPAFEMAALELEPGQLSEIVEGMHGYHIILRLPMQATEEIKETFINEQMSLMGSLWIESAQIELTDAGKALDAKAVYDAMQIYRNTIAQLMGKE
ncbi:MAG: peptidylprolyl isomerase [Oscillospiraceae bacterium]|nr:peptidylprolyl isomerase [Oscillospiraceae bacterium]